ncbi:MAG TPA: hypothetical protein VN081_00945 [Dongiaceae bacterium]|nr:hypothetical protein [Dongiaceae bacterium]
MGKGKRLRALRDATPTFQGDLTNTKVAPDEKSISQMKHLGMTEFTVAGPNRAQRRRDEKADRHEEALARNWPTNRTIWGRMPRQAFQRERVARRVAGEAESIKKARAIDFRARRATMQVQHG